jgi:hypothetical protein
MAKHETTQSVAIPGCVSDGRMDFSIPVFCQQVVSPTPAQAAAAAESYPNTPDGLRQLLLELLRLARTDDQAKLRVQIAAMEIPVYGNWFARAFGQEKGQNLGDKYEESLKASELNFELLWIELAKQQGQISINRLDPEMGFGIPSGTLDAYRANWRKTDDSAGPDNQSIGVFYFVDGRFRVDRSRHDVRVLSTDKTGPVTLGKLEFRSPLEGAVRLLPRSPSSSRTRSGSGSAIPVTTAMYSDSFLLTGRRCPLTGPSMRSRLGWERMPIRAHPGILSQWV